MQSPLRELAPTQSGQSLRVLVWDRDLVDMWCLDAAGRRVPYRGQGSNWHVHGELELTVITAGSGVLYVGDHIGRFAAPDCILLGAEVPHVWKSDGAMAGVAVQFRLDATTGLAALAEFAGLERLWVKAGFGLRWRGATGAALRDQVLDLEGRPALERLSRFLAIAGTMLGGSDGDAQELSQRVLTSGGAQRRRSAMDRVLDHIMEHYRDELALGDLVHMSGSSQATFCRHFVRATGRTFTAYLTAIRLQDVRHALLASNRSVTDVAFAAGFNNLSHFHAVFRGAEGCTPLEFRRRHAAR